MILTITANPSVDITYGLKELKMDSVNRCNNVKKAAGGKGLHVSYVLQQLGADTVATGFLGGALGKLIVDELNDRKLKNDFTVTEGETRNCIAILHEGKQTEILEEGPAISEAEEQSFFKDLDLLFDDTDIVIISGSLPKNLKPEFYSKIIDKANKRGIFSILDTSGDTLNYAVNSDITPNCIKPNVHEFLSLFHRESESGTESVIRMLKSEKLKDIPMIFISMGKDGALAKIGGSVYTAKVPSVRPVNPVGSGDATVAGIAYAVWKDCGNEEILRIAMTCGVLNTIEEETGYIDMRKFDDYYHRVQISKVEEY